MTVSPERSRRVAREVRRIYQDADDVMIRRLVRAIAKGLDQPDWAAAKLADLRTVLAGVDKELRRLEENAPDLFSRVLAEAYQEGSTSGLSDLRAAGIDPTGGVKGSHAVDALADDLVSVMDGARPRVLRGVADAFQRITADTSEQVVTGTVTRREAAREAVRRCALDGIKGFVDESGRQWELGAYAEMATRTTAGNALVQGKVDQMRAYGHDLVIVSTSPGTCSLCEPWEGEVLSIGSSDPTGEAIASLDEARDAGLMHPNCGHTVDLYLPGHSTPSRMTSDPEKYRQRQRQRAFERSVRRHKRSVLIDEETLGKDSPQAVKSRQKLRARQSEFREFRDEHGLKNLPYRTNLKHR